MSCQCSVPDSNATIAVTKDDSIRAFSHRDQSGTASTHRDYKGDYRTVNYDSQER